MSIESEMDATIERAKREAATRLADDLDRLCCAETEREFFDYVTDRVGNITALLRVYAKTPALQNLSAEPVASVDASKLGCPDTVRNSIREECAKICDEVVARADRLMEDPKASKVALAAVSNGAMECAENIRAALPPSPGEAG